MSAVDEARERALEVLADTCGFDGPIRHMRAAVPISDAINAMLALAASPTPPAVSLSGGDGLSADVVALVIAAREAFDTDTLPLDEQSALDQALEAFASRVPYANDPANLDVFLPKVDEREAGK